MDVVIKNIMHWLSNINNIAVILTCVTLIVAYMTYHVNKVSKQIAKDLSNHDKAKYEQEVDAKAREFISKYNMKQSKLDIPKISKIDLCVIAYMFNPIYSYKDNMYTDFNNLSTDVQNKVLELRKSPLKIDNTNKFIYETFRASVIDITRQNYPQLLKLLENYENNFGNILADIDIYDNRIGQLRDFIYQHHKNDLYHNSCSISESFENNSFDDLINNFYDIGDEYTSYMYYSYKLCKLIQEICKYSTNKDKQIMDSYIIGQELDDININSTFTYEDEFLFTIYVWYIRDKIINKNI